jgi:Plasmid pRiA4b ORF-3-like protein
MPTQTGPTLAQVAEAIAAELDAAIPFDEFVQRVLARYESKAKNPAQLVRTNLRYELPHLGVVFLDPKTLIPLRVAMQGVRFRVPLDAEQLNHGAIWYDDWFTPFSKPVYSYRAQPESPTFFDSNAQPIPARFVALKFKASGARLDDFLAAVMGRDEIDREALELRDWLNAHKAQRDDSILVTVRDWEQAQFTLEFEPRSQRRQAEIKQQNQALADAIWGALQETTDEKLMLPAGIATAYARLSSAREYPGDHWHQVLADDPRMREEMAMIVPVDFKSWFDLALDERGAVKEQRFDKAQAQQVYRFSARANYAKRRRTIEILGKHTLGDFDDIMRAAFDLDTSDHLSEFTRIIRRGKGKYPHKTPYGEINPFEPTPAMKVRVAGLGLEIGAELEYVYDFGDWLDHKLILESVGDTEKGVKYPRVVSA